jgi:hypothetical protein
MIDTPAPSGPGQDDNQPGTPPGPGDYPELGSPDWRLVPSSPDWPGGEAGAADDHDPGEDDLDLWEDPEAGPPSWLDDARLAALIVEAREITADQARAAEAAARSGHAVVLGALEAVSGGGRRGPGMPGSAESLPGEYAGPAAGFATGKPLDTAPGGAALASFLEDVAGDDDRCRGATDDELLGIICAWARLRASAGARGHAAVAELIRRRPAPGCAVDGETGMPQGWSQFTARELGVVLGLCDGDAEAMLGLAHVLETCLPGTRALFRAGVLDQDKAEIIAHATMLLDPAEARAAEAMVLDRAGALTPAALRAAIHRAVMEVAPGKARKRREQMAKHTRVERWAEDSGNAGLAGRELPPAEVLAADQRVTAWAKELRKAGLDGGMDALRARAFLDILLGTDSRPLGSRPDGTPGQDTGSRGSQDSAGPGGTGAGLRDGGPTSGSGSGPQDGAGPGGGGGLGPHQPGAPRIPAPGGPLDGVIPPGFAGRVNLTVPVVTLAGLADRPGEMDGIGPIDPDLARDLADAAARNPRSTWCVTVTDSQGHAIGHGCARPAPADGRGYRAKRDKTGAPGGPDPPGRARFNLTPADQPGPAGGYGTWRFSTGVPGQRDLLLEIGPLSTEECDHRHQARGHDPGVMLRHLTQIRYATCTGPGCRRPAGRCDFEHNVPYETGGRTCMCNTNPTCRFDHRVKQDPQWKVEQMPDGRIRWTTPSGRQCTTEPTRHPI